MTKITRSKKRSAWPTISRLTVKLVGPPHSDRARKVHPIFDLVLAGPGPVEAGGADDLTRPGPRDGQGATAPHRIVEGGAEDGLLPAVSRRMHGPDERVRRDRMERAPVPGLQWPKPDVTIGQYGLKIDRHY
ncbi:hypothetical protein [Rhizorhabdus sp.]|uniref:hypothetical protein n=1 Tax=Rhizorhabdus sp. TaxID=1968843 RepID=UPI0035ADC8AC